MTDSAKPTRGPIRRAISWAAPKPGLWVNARQIKGLATIIRQGYSDVFSKRAKVVQTWEEAASKAQQQLGLDRAGMEAHLAGTRKHLKLRAWFSYFGVGLCGVFLVFAFLKSDWAYMITLIPMISVFAIYGLRAAFRVWQIDRRALGGLQAFLSERKAWFPK
jgi:hypothetical protein